MVQWGVGKGSEFLPPVVEVQGVVVMLYRLCVYYSIYLLLLNLSTLEPFLKIYGSFFLNN